MHWHTLPSMVEYASVLVVGQTLMVHGMASRRRWISVISVSKLPAQELQHVLPAIRYLRPYSMRTMTRDVLQQDS